MKRLISILLLVTVLYNSAGYYVAFQIMRFQIKQEVFSGRAGCDKLAGLVLMKQKTGDHTFNFVEDNEFLWEGEMYDVLRQETVGNETWFYCVKDTEEDALLTTLEEQVQQNGDTPAQNAKHVQSLLLKDIIPPSENNTLPVVTAAKQFSAIYNCRISNPDAGILGPPPRIS